MGKYGSCTLYHNNLQNAQQAHGVKFIPVLTTFCTLGLKFLELFCVFYKRFKGFCMLKIIIMGEGTRLLQLNSK